MDIPEQSLRDVFNDVSKYIRNISISLNVVFPYLPDNPDVPLNPNQTSENKKTKNDGARGLSIATDATSLDISDQGERNDTGKKPRVLLIKKISEWYKKVKHLRQESQKPGDIWLLDYAIMNQTTEGHEQETVVLVIIDAYSSLVRVIPCKKRGNVLPHILDTITRVQARPCKNV